MLACLNYVHQLTCCLSNYAGWKMRYVWRDCCLLITSLCSSNSACFQMLVCVRCSYIHRVSNSNNQTVQTHHVALWKWILTREIVWDVGLALEMLFCKQGGEAWKGSNVVWYLRVLLTDWCWPWGKGLRTSQIRDCIMWMLLVPF